MSGMGSSLYKSNLGKLGPSVCHVLINVQSIECIDGLIKFPVKSCAYAHKIKEKGDLKKGRIFLSLTLVIDVM